MKFLSILLTEGRKEDLKKKYSNKFKEEDLDFILGISDLQDFNHKYTDWILKNIPPNIETLSYVAEVGVSLVKDFDKYQKNLEKKDINQYSNFQELENAIQPFKLKEEEKALESQTEKIYEDDNFLVVVPKTIEASCKYGSGTKWCTTVKGASHFERYTGNNQGLYYIIRKKGNRTEPHYKVAVHINNIGSETWWDAQDNLMSSDSIKLFKEYFPELYSTIKTSFEEKNKKSLEDLDKYFYGDTVWSLARTSLFNSPKILKLELVGFHRIPDMSGKAMANLQISLDDVIIDEYDVFVNYNIKNNTSWRVSVGFGEDFETEPKYDFEFWKGWGIDSSFYYDMEPSVGRNAIADLILKRVFDKIRIDGGFEKYVKGISGPTWRPDRHNYGYTFGKNKGLIRKLVDYLDAGYDNGTKLDFLEYIGKLKSKVVDGKKQYAHSYSDVYHPSNQWRGHFASFFASAKNAGIIQYEKEGSKFIIKPGPNFEAFKKGELKAL